MVSEMLAAGTLIDPDRCAPTLEATLAPSVLTEWGVLGMRSALTYVPRIASSYPELAAKLFRRHFRHPGHEDAVIVHSVARGVKDGRPAEVGHDLLVSCDRKNGMTAMMRATAFPASIVAQMAAGGLIEPGAHTVEAGAPPGPFIEEARRRGFNLSETFRWL